MGCGSSSLGVIREEDINPPIIHSIPNSQIKTDLFPEGEIYYLLNSETLKQGAQNENKHFLSYDELKIELTISYKFYKEDLSCSPCGGGAYGDPITDRAILSCI